MRHPFQVSIVPASGPAIIVAKRSTADKAKRQANDLRMAIGQYNRNGVPEVRVTDLRVEVVAPARFAGEDDAD